MAPLTRFFAEAQRRRAAMEQQRAREQAALIAENRAAWDRVLDEIRAQLPEILRDYVVVNGPEVLDERPSRSHHHRYIQLQVPLCAPISFGFKVGLWQIADFWPRHAIGLEESDDGEPYLRSTADEGYHDIYIAVAEAHDHYPVWQKLEDELDWWLHGTKPAGDEDDSQAIVEALAEYQAQRREDRKLGDLLT
jgi:hypothetical protein